MSVYPDRWHPVYFLIDALKEQGAAVEFAKGERTAGTWGMIVNGRVVVWLIDNRHAHEAAHEDPAAKELLARGALVMHAQKPDMERVGGHWLSLAASPGYTPKDMPKLWDCAFIGFIRTEARADFLATINSRFSLSTASGLFGEDAVNTYRQARVGVNVPTNWGAADGYDSANMRCFEILATGIPLVTAYEPYLDELGLIANVNYVPYVTMTEAIEAVRYALAHPEIGDAGARLVAERHEYKHRAKQVLEWLGGVS